MAKYQIHFTNTGEPYIREKNFGFKGKEGTSSHWTWHFTERGIHFLSRNAFGRRTALPTYITHKQLKQLKARNMLCKSDSSLIGSTNGHKKKGSRKIRILDPVRSTSTPIRPIAKSTSTQAHKQIPSLNSPVHAPRKKRSLWGWVKALFHKK